MLYFIHEYISELFLLQVVDYKKISESEEYKHYERLTLELQRVNLDDTTEKEKLAFFINLYNSLVIHGSIKNGPPDGLWQRYKVNLDQDRP